MSHTVGKVLVVGMNGLRHDLLTRTPAAAPVLHSLMTAGAHGTSLLPHGKTDRQSPDRPPDNVARTQSGPAGPPERGEP